LGLEKGGGRSPPAAAFCVSALFPAEQPQIGGAAIAFSTLGSTGRPI